MTVDEIFSNLMSFKNRQMFLDDNDEDYFNSIMHDVGKALNLPDEQCAILADDELPDDLITITEAARILDVTTNAISNRIARRDIPSYTDNEATNPRHAKRVSRYDIEELLSQNAKTIQNELASMYREQTGKVPRGQLWQECEKRGCSIEPVCMNCMLCEEAHCRCFD